MKNVFLPRSFSELWDYLQTNPDAAVYAGGTDLLVKMRGGLLNPHSLLCLERLGELRGVREESETICIGSCTTHAHLLEHPLIRKHFPVLVQALRVLGSPLIRNMGSIGGNICTASPAGDTLPPLYVLDAELELRTRHRDRRVPIRDFIIAPGQTLLEHGEILAAIRIKKPEGYNIHHFEKVGQRNALACSVASLAALLHVSSDGVVEKVALAWGSVAPTILLCPEAEKALTGKTLLLQSLREAAAIVREATRPISDVRAEAEYRRVVSGNLLLRLKEVADSSAISRPESVSPDHKRI